MIDAKQFKAIHAALRADAMLEAGDLDGYAVWRRILRAVDPYGGQGTIALSLRARVKLQEHWYRIQHRGVNGRLTSSVVIYKTLQSVPAVPLPLRASVCLPGLIEASI